LNVPVSAAVSTILTFVLFAEEVWMNTSLKRDCAVLMLVFLSASTRVTSAYVPSVYESASKAKVASDALNDRFFVAEDADGAVSMYITFAIPPCTVFIVPLFAPVPPPVVVVPVVIVARNVPVFTPFSTRFIVKSVPTE
jgi:hypothetical protein